MPSSQLPATDVTRLEVLGLIEPAFVTGVRITRDDLLKAAEANGGRRQVIDLLAKLPASPLSGPGDLWNHFPHVPIGE